MVGYAQKVCKGVTIFPFEMESLDGKFSFLTGPDFVLLVEGGVVSGYELGKEWLVPGSNHLRRCGFLVTDRDFIHSQASGYGQGVGGRVGLYSPLQWGWWWMRGKSSYWRRICSPC
jgi:hypothetical protein